MKFRDILLFLFIVGLGTSLWGIISDSDEESGLSSSSSYTESNFYDYYDSSDYTENDYYSSSVYPESNLPENTLINEYGSAGEFSETTLLVSIFANDAQTRWDFSTARDSETSGLMYRNLGIAADWLVSQGNAYGVYPRFIYEWDLYPDLVYIYDFGMKNLVRPDGTEYKTQLSYITSNIPSEELKQKYDAENIIYIFYFNTDEHNTVNSWSAGNQRNQADIINVFVRDDYPSGYYYMSSSCFAHEILHCFGAHDLYYSSFDITQEYVDYCRNSGSNDIMFTVGVEDYITQSFSPLDAYYIGLTNYCEDVSLWGLGKSRYFIP